jgi:hypothetical protein
MSLDLSTFAIAQITKAPILEIKRARMVVPAIETGKTLRHSVIIR